MKISKLLMVTAAIAVTAEPAFAQGRPTRPADRLETREDRDGRDWHLYLSSGFSYSQRDEAGEPQTDYYRIPLSARLSNGRFRISASIPYLIVKGPASVIDDDDDGGEEVPPTAARETRRGFGDLQITGRYRIPDDELGGFELDLMGRVKLPTASRSKRLGTGEADFAVGAELSREMGKLEPFVSGQYRINGDPPDRDYRNTVATSVGTDFRLSSRSRASLAWDYTQSRTKGRSGSHMIDAGLSTRLGRTLTLSGDAAVGLSENAPDFRVGAALTARVF